MRFIQRGALAFAGALLACCAWRTGDAEQIGLQNPTATFSQTSFSVSNLTNNIYPQTSTSGEGWGNNGLGNNVAVFETTSDLSTLPNLDGTLRFNLFHGGFTASHSIGKYRFSYTTDPRSSFADGLANGGDVTANWIPIVPSSVISSGGATLTIQGDGSVLASGANPLLTTDTVYATFDSASRPITGITGFRIEAIEDASFPVNGPGRSPNGNFVARELDVAAFAGTRVALQSGTARASQGGFSVDNLIDGRMPFTSAGGDGWANDVGGTLSNVATFETVTTLPNAQNHLVTIEILSGGFGTHTLGNFRISATTADRSLFADGNDNGGGGVGNEGIWTVLDAISIVSDNGATIFNEDADHFITASGASAEFEHYTLTFLTNLSGVTGFRLETPEIALSGLPTNGPGRAANGNFVIREFSVYAAAVPEPASIAAWALLGVVGLGCAAARYRLRKAK